MGARIGSIALAVVLLQGCTVMVEFKPTAGTAAPLDFSDPVLNQRRIFVVGGVSDTSAADTIRQLLFLDAANDRAIDLYLMTPGGDLDAAMAVVRVLRTLRSKVNTHALGACNSGGALLLAAGTGEREAFDDSTIVLHGIQPKGGPPLRYLELTQETYTAFWQEHAKLPREWLPMPKGKLHVLTAEEARDYGIVDRVVTRAQ